MPTQREMWVGKKASHVQWQPQKDIQNRIAWHNQDLSRREYAQKNMAWANNDPSSELNNNLVDLCQIKRRGEGGKTEKKRCLRPCTLCFLRAHFSLHYHCITGSLSVTNSNCIIARVQHMSSVCYLCEFLKILSNIVKSFYVSFVRNHFDFALYEKGCHNMPIQAHQKKERRSTRKW